MRHRKDLIIDVGLHNGNDTAYYLHKGFVVVAIDANPAMVERAKDRFAKQIQAGRLILLNVGITKDSGQQDFFVSSDFSEWSSFDESNATKGGNSANRIRVSCVRFQDVLAEHGVPRYLKIDIEGNDRLCLDALASDSLPAFISLEMSHRRGDEDIRTMSELGYNRFKCIRQNDFRAFTPENVARRSAFRKRASGPGFPGKVLRTWRTLMTQLSPPREGDWKFEPGTSGPFGDDLPGRWMNAEETLSIWKALHDIDLELSSGGLGEWFDIHATKA
jgi:FkbM family methyltransferase